ncbi:MAG: ATP-binding protein, partial [Myxococcales bacterium]|nr:ATP-binding protein [Myxococcales bacterium]
NDRWLASTVQHSPPQSPVSAHVHARADRASVDVHNEGAVPRELLPTLFEPFGPSSAHGGNVEVDSAVESGTTFRLSLPRDPAGHGSSP